MTSGTMAGIPLSTDQARDRWLRKVGSLIQDAIAGEPSAYSRLQAEGGEKAVQAWIDAVESPEYAARKALAKKVASLRGTSRLQMALDTLSGDRRA
jgi:hypothetical protein